ncbi:MAG: hypothetical protein IKC99_05585 [Clostridia bacterium]|nr:hypothetical protein [Clostridia bacterium]
MKKILSIVFVLLLLLLPSCQTESQTPDDSSSGVTLNESAVTATGEKLALLQEKYYPNLTFYTAVVPAKAYYSEEGDGGEYNRISALLKETMIDMTFIDLTSSLSADSYYTTDPHWKQEKLSDTVKVLGEAMAFAIPENADPTPHTFDSFRGYDSRAGAGGEETLTYLTDTFTDSAAVSLLDTASGGFVPSVMYDEALLEGEDAYNVFLSGAQPLIQIENPLAEKERTLVIFRDSFGSSLTPLLVAPYSTIYVVDLRYIASPLLANYFSVTEGDALLLYGTAVLKSGAVLKIW